MKLNEIKILKEGFIDPIKGLDEVVALIRENCSDALKNLNDPILRGMTDMGAYAVMHGEAGARKSRNTSNHYTVIMDEVLPAPFPKRSASIICGNYANKLHAEEYGELYCILPFNSVICAWTPADDMFYTPITIAERTAPAHTWNNRFLQMGIPDTSYQDIVTALTKYRDTGIISGKPYQGWVDDVEDFDKELRRAYDDPFDYSTTKDPRWNDSGDPVEMWIGGKVVAVRMSNWGAVKAALKS